MERRDFRSGTAWEPLVGYARAVRVGPLFMFRAQLPRMRAGQLLHGVIPTVRRSRRCGIFAEPSRPCADLEHVVRTRLYVTNIEHWPAVGRAHREVFGSIRPATTMVAVARLISSEILVEIEADAVVP